jgi:hypothetical protein
MLPSEFKLNIILEKESANYFGIAVGGLIAVGIILGIVSGVLIARSIS